jgi:hypothetical protein
MNTCSDCRFYMTCESAVSGCPACSGFLPIFRRTLFDRLRDTPEGIAKFMVYREVVNPLIGRPYKVWRSSLAPRKEYFSRTAAFNATVAKLKEVEE